MRSGGDAVPPHPGRPEFGGPGAGERFQRSLGGAVTRLAGNSLERGHGGDVDDAAATPLQHPRNQARDQKVGAADIGAKQLLEHGHVLVDRQRGWEAAGIVHDDVDIAALPHKLIHGLGIRHVGRNESGVRTDGRNRLLAPVPVAAVMMTVAPSLVSNRADSIPMLAVPPVITVFVHSGASGDG